MNHQHSNFPGEGFFPDAVSRRQFFAGMAAVSGTLLWTSAAPASAHTGAGAPDAAAGAAQPDGGQQGGNSSGLQVGCALADITGEPLGAGMDGYAVLSQASTGLKRRQYARTFIFVDPSNPQKRVVNCTADMGMMFQCVYLEVVRRLQERFGDLYNETNVLIAATHTHVAPGGTSQHALVDFTTVGFRPVTFEAQVAGIVDSIARAHENIGPAEVTIAQTNLHDCGVNRSRPSWERNPNGDKAEFPDAYDPRCITLHVHRDGKAVGLINWYALHATSLPPEYKYISGDNKGYAAWATEEAMGVDHRHPENAPFVAAFAQTNPGDITPNHGLRPGTGPGRTDDESVRILGTRIMGGIDGRFQWVDMREVQVDGKWTPDGKPGRTTPAILGASFAASSQEDGGGEPLLGFQEGERGGTPWVAEVTKAVYPQELREWQDPKEALLLVGVIPGLVQQTHSFSVWRIGGIVLANLGFEPTITSGLRIRRAVGNAMGIDPNNVIVQGYTNGYGHYIATPEEYMAQNYEGGATIFGRLELPAITQIFDGLASALKNGTEVEHGPVERDLTGSSRSPRRASRGWTCRRRGATSATCSRAPRAWPRAAWSASSSWARTRTTTCTSARATSPSRRRTAP